MNKVEKLVKAFKLTGLVESERIELDNLDRARLVYDESGEVVVENEHGTEFPVSDLSNGEIDVFMFTFGEPVVEPVPDDLIDDMIITIGLFADMFNCNDEALAKHGIDWWYLHKINRRLNKFRK